MTNENRALEQANAQLDNIRDMVDALEVDYDRLEELRDASTKQRSVIAGTHRPQDLIPAFLEELRELDNAAYAQLVADISGVPVVGESGNFPAYVIDIGDDSDWWVSAGAGYLLGSLFDALDNAAPDGLQFGAHPGDGSDFGFWLPEETASELEELEEQANGCESLEEAEQRINEDALSVEVRSDWATPGNELESTEYRIVLCTGGPHVEIRGDLDRHGEPASADLYYSDWFEGLKRRGVNSDGEQALLTYARKFYFGE